MIELYQPLSKSMRNIQNAIVECLDATLNELKKSSKTVSSSLMHRMHLPLFGVPLSSEYFLLFL